MTTGWQGHHLIMVDHNVRWQIATPDKVGHIGTQCGEGNQVFVALWRFGVPQRGWYGAFKAVF